MKRNRSNSNSGQQPRRSGRIKKREDKALEKRMEKLGGHEPSHFMPDVTGIIKRSIQHDKKLNKDDRGDLRDSFKQSRIKGGKDIMPPFLRSQIGDSFRQKKPIQNDMRKSPRGKDKYDGFMLTTTYVKSHDDSQSEKEIREPLSPRLGLGDRMDHRSHTAPFSLGGSETNDLKTVYRARPNNLGVDSRIEKRALHWKEKNYDVVHFSVDSWDRSTVGIVGRKQKTKVRKREEDEYEYKMMGLSSKRRRLNDD